MDAYIIYDINQIIALVANTLLGSATYVVFQVNYKKKKVTLGYLIGTFIISLFVANATSEYLAAKELEMLKSTLVSLAAFIATYLIKWLDQDYIRIFNTIFDGIMGLIIKSYTKDKDDYTENIYKDDYKRDDSEDFN